MSDFLRPGPLVMECHRIPLEVDVDLDQAVSALRAEGPLVALDSALQQPGQGERSFLAIRPLQVVSFRQGRWQVEAGRSGPADSSATELDGAEHQPFGGLQQLVQALPTYPGCPWGAYGYFGYECLDAVTARQPQPDAWFLITDVVLEWQPGSRRPVLWCSDLADAESLRKILGSAKSSSMPETVHLDPPELFEDSDLKASDYQVVFDLLKDELRQGNSYQLCFTYPIERRFDADPWQLYRVLRCSNPAPFSSYLQAADFAVVSSSPERFLRVDAEGQVEARPMKGTARKSDSAEANRRIAESLQRSTKDRAENLMIADLLRNDLGRVCSLGSVEVTEPARLEEYATVFQLVSEVRGQLAADQDGADLLKAAFPPGSMTGAPKVRSMEILRRFEGSARGPYSGVMGYWHADGAMDLSVLIRTWVVAEGVARASVGGGIVWDSTAHAEFEETRTKALALLRAYSAVMNEPKSAGAAGA